MRYATGASIQETESLIPEAIELHLERASRQMVYPFLPLAQRRIRRHFRLSFTFGLP